MCCGFIGKPKRAESNHTVIEIILALGTKILALKIINATSLSPSRHMKMMPLKIVFISVWMGLAETMINKLLAGMYKMAAAIKNAVDKAKLLGRRANKSAPQTPHCS